MNKNSKAGPNMPICSNRMPSELPYCENPPQITRESRKYRAPQYLQQIQDEQKKHKNALRPGRRDWQTTH